jgi:Putative Flp pilus-assembly TadE/G-like
MAVSRRTQHGERGQVVVMFALLLPVLLGIGAAVIGIGNWYTHARTLQTKADAAAFAGAGVWDFPCVESVTSGPTSTQKITDEARKYFGPHTQANGTLYNSTTFNRQVGRVDGARVHVVLNGSDYYDDDSSPTVADESSPANPSICGSSVLDVKATEDNSFPLFSLLPLFPDIKRKARVEIRQIEGLSGLLPISVRIPKPVSAAAVFYNEQNKGILAASYFCEKSGIPGMPAGNTGWTTFDPANPSGLCSSWTNLSVAQTTGVVVASSFLPACSGSVTTGCFKLTGFSSIDDLCRQGAGKAVQCFYATGLANSQTVQQGLQFIRGYAPGTVTNGPPALRSAWFDAGSCSSSSGSSYFASVTGSCSAILRATIDIGSVTAPPPPPGGTQTRTAANTEVRYRIVYRNPGNGNLATTCAFTTPTCDLNGSGGPGNTSWQSTNTLPLFAQQTAGNAIAIRVRFRNTTVGSTNCGNNFGSGCQWFFTGNGISTTAPTDAQVYAAPVQRSFMGDDDMSGPIKFLRLTGDSNCDGLPGPGAAGEEASVTAGGNHCFYVDMGMKGVIAQDQDEPPVVFNLKGSQSAVLDCDPNLSNVKSEIVAGCSPYYAVNLFNTNPDCPAPNQFFVVPKAAPFDDWPPYRCVLTQTGNPTQILDGFAERILGPGSNPPCPGEGAGWTKGRNYWHDANNPSGAAYAFANQGIHPNNLKDNDPRNVWLFMTAYNSFTASGNETFPVVNFGDFYVTGWGKGGPGGALTNEDPCTGGNSNSSPGAGNKPPPDIVTEPGGAYVWGHFINNVVPSGAVTPSDNLCAPTTSFMPCVAVLTQ